MYVEDIVRSLEESKAITEKIEGIISDPVLAKKQIADLLNAHNEDKPTISQLRWGLSYAFLWHLIVSGTVAFGAHFLLGLNETSSAIVFAGCMIQTLHKGFAALLHTGHLHTQMQIANGIKALTIAMLHNHIESRAVHDSRAER